MSDPLTLAVSIAGLISLAQTLIPLVVRYADDVRSFPTELTDLVGEIRGLCGVLCLLHPVITKLEDSSRPQTATEIGFIFCGAF